MEKKEAARVSYEGSIKQRIRHEAQTASLDKQVKIPDVTC